MQYRKYVFKMSNIVIVQPAIPVYREDFFNRLSDHFGASLRVLFSSDPQNAGCAFGFQSQIVPLVRLPGNLMWQIGVSSLPVERGDVVVLPANPRYLSSFAFLVRARLIGVRTVVWGHYRSSTSRGWRMSLRLLLGKLADAMLFYTDQEVHEYRSSVGKGDQRLIGALNNGINVAPIRLFRSSYAMTSRERAIFFVGRLTEKADLSLLLMALSNDACSEIALHIVGTGKDEATLRHQAANLGVADRVVWHGASTDEAVIAAVANKCRIFVYPGEVGLSLIHAMAYGLPCVIHDDPMRHMPEIAAFSPSKTGSTFVRGDAEDLANVIGSLIDDADKLERLSLKCIEVTEKKFNTQSMSENFINFIGRVI